MRSIALANQKGGVGKTTTAVHLAHGLSLAGSRVVLLDLDPQGNATVALQSMSYEGGTAEGPFELMRQAAERLWILPSPGAERPVPRATQVDVGGLSNLAAELEHAGVDWLVVDCPPRMDQWGWAGIQLCEHVLVPVQAEFFAIHGLSLMLQTLEEARHEFPGKGELFGVVPTLVDMREPVAAEVLADLRKTLGDKMLRSIIFRDSQLVEAASHGTTVFQYNPQSKASLCYGELVREVQHGRQASGQRS